MLWGPKHTFLCALLNSRVPVPSKWQVLLLSSRAMRAIPHSANAGVHFWNVYLDRCLCDLALWMWADRQVPCCRDYIFERTRLASAFTVGATCYKVAQMEWDDTLLSIMNSLTLDMLIYASNTVAPDIHTTDIVGTCPRHAAQLIISHAEHAMGFLVLWHSPCSLAHRSVVTFLVGHRMWSYELV
jgi:hypothetical protein